VTTQWFADELERRTNGDYKIRIHWGGSLAGPNEIPTAIENGTGDIGDVITPYFPDLLPINNAISFHVPQPLSTVEVGLYMTYWHEIHPEFAAELAKYNMIAVGMRPLESYGILCTKPVRSVEEFKGLRLRSYGFAIPAVVEALGAVPVAMSTNDTYEGLSRGIIDCSPIGPTLARGWKFDEVAKYYVDVPLGASWGHLITMNKAKFDSLPENIQYEIRSIGREYLVRYTTEMLKQDEEIRAAWKGDLGVEVIPFDGAAFTRMVLASPAVKKVREQWAEKVKATGFDPAGVMATLSFQ
jgi:TRAP-type C4-dicarboxylate transport system substrate-binding protein